MCILEKMAGARSADQSAAKKSLSKNVMQMKFMIRGKDQEEKQEVKSRRKHSESQWYIGGDEKTAKKTPFSFNVSYVDCEDLIPYGRMSFLNFNPNIEKKHREILRMVKAQVSGQREEFDGISDEEMAERYETLVNTVAKKFQKKRRREQTSDTESSADEFDPIEKRAKRGFIKPREDETFEF